MVLKCSQIKLIIILLLFCKNRQIMEKRISTKKSDHNNLDQPNRKSKDIKISFTSGGSDLLEFTKNS